MLSAPVASIILLAKVWAVMYALVGLCIGLGLLVVGRPSKRKVLKDDR